jgi:hypothetical protein
MPHLKIMYSPDLMKVNSFLTQADARCKILLWVRTELATWNVAGMRGKKKTFLEIYIQGKKNSKTLQSLTCFFDVNKLKDNLIIK